MNDVGEVLENHIWIGVAWREAFVVPFIPSTVPGWSDACFEPVEWPGSGQPRSDGDQGWCIVRSPATDADGWVYGTAFDHLREDRPGGRASKRTNDRVRSRLWRRVDATAQQQATGAQDGSRISSPGSRCDTSSAAAAAGAAAGQAAAGVASAGKAAWAGAVHAVQTSMPGAVKRASFAGMVNTFLKLVKDAAARHNTAMITPDITGWFFVISTHSDELKRQQLGQLQQLVWFSREQKLQQSMRQGGLGTNPPGVVLQGAAAALAALEASKQPQAAAAAAAGGGSAGVQDASQAAAAVPLDGSAANAAAALQGSAASCTRRPAASSSTQGASGGGGGGQHMLKGLPFSGLKMHIGSGSSASKGPSQQQPRQEPRSSSSTSSSKTPGSPAAGSPAGVQLHVGPLSVLEDLLAGAQYSQAAYGYVAAAGHLSNLGNAIKMLATLPHFNAITGASLEANIRAMHTLAGFCPQDVLLAAWHNDTFRPCHYVAIDMKRGNIVLGVRGSLELGDLETDVTAAPLPFEFQGVAGWVHEGLLAAAAYVVSNTVDALAEAAQRCPGWPLVVAGHSLGGGVAALVTLLLQQPGAAPRGISGVRCITIGPPAVLSQELCGLCEEYITSIILGADAIPRLSTFSVESLLLDLVNMSLSRRVTNQLAATTSSMAASTAGAINSLAAGLSRLANTATNNVVSNVNSMKSSLASFKALPGFPLIDTSLTGLCLGIPGTVADDGSNSSGGGAAAGAAAAQGLLLPGEQCSAGTGSVELTRRHLQQQEQAQGLAALRAEVSTSGGLKQVHAMLQDDREQRRASMEAPRHPHMPATPQQQQQQQQAAAAAVESGAADARPKLGLTQPPAAATQFDDSLPKSDAAAAAPAQQHAASSGSALQQQQQQQQWDANSGSPAVPRWQKEHSSSSFSSSKPGGPKLVSGGPAVANIMIFPKHDDANIITGIQEAWAGLKPHSKAVTSAAAAAAAADGSNGSSSGSQPAAQQPQQRQAQPSQPAAAAEAARRLNSSSRKSSVTPFGIEQQQQRPSSAGAEPSACSGAVGATRSAAAAAQAWPGAAAAAAASAGAESAAATSPAAAHAGLPGGRGDSSSSTSSSMKRCTSEPSLQQWASDGLQPLGEPSWAKLSRSSAGADAVQQQQQQQGRADGGKSGVAGGSAVGDSTVHALESDLKKTARLYPPGRILWILSEELVGPAAHQLITAVAAHLTPAAATAAAAAASSAAAAKQHTSIGNSTSHLKPPSPAQMDMPTSVMGPGSKPVLRTQPKQQRQPHQQQPHQQQPDAPPLPISGQRPSAASHPQKQAVSSRTAARDAATAHAVAAASAKHILQDVHSLDARRAAAAALQAAQHEHPPLHLQSAQDAAPQLEQQLRLQQQDLQAAEAAAAPADSTLLRQDAAATGGGGGSSGPQAAGSSQVDGKQQLKPLRTLRTSTPSSVQMAEAVAPGSPAACSAAAAGAQTAAAAASPAANRSSSGPMEVDGSAAGRAAGHGWPTSWGSADGLDPDDLPQELQELMQILGTPCDAASALAIGYKKQVLLQHFWQQRQREASAAAAAAATGSRQRTDSSGGGGGGSSRRVRSCSDSHLMQFEDMIRAVDDLSGAEGAAAAGSSSGTVIPQLELVDHSWWGTVSSLRGGSSSGGSGSGSKASKQQGTAAAAAAAGEAGGAAGLESAPRRGLPMGASHRLDDAEGPAGSAANGAATAAGTAAAGSQQVGDAEAAGQASQQQQQQQQHVQLALVQESDDYVVWAAQQAAQHQRQREQQRQQQDAAAAAAAAEAATKQQLSLPELAAESLVELAQLPERIAESLGGLKFGAGSIGDGAADDGGCGDLGPGAAAGLAALCAPVLIPAGSDGAAATAAAVSANGVRLPPVVVMPERDVFSRLLLHRTAVLDHLPSNYVKVLTEMKEAFSSM